MNATLRPLTALDSAAARALVDAVLDDAPYTEPFRAAIEGALRFAGEEHRAIIAHHAGVVIGIVAFGETAGAQGAGRIHFVAVDERVRRRGVATALIEAAAAALREDGARFVAIELPEEPPLAPGRRVADRAGFHEEARVTGYVRDGVALALLRRDLGAAR